MGNFRTCYVEWTNFTLRAAQVSVIELPQIENAVDRPSRLRLRGPHLLNDHIVYVVHPTYGGHFYFL